MRKDERGKHTSQHQKCGDAFMLLEGRRKKEAHLRPEGENDFDVLVPAQRVEVVHGHLRSSAGSVYLGCRVWG